MPTFNATARLPNRRMIGGRLALVCAAAALSSCQMSPPPLAPSAATVLRFFGIAQDPPPAAPPASSLELYIDGSQSMRGFVDNPNSIYGKTLTAVYTNALTARYNVEAYKFSSQIEPLGQALVSDLASPAFYGGGDTPLSQLLRRVASHVAAGAVCVIVTDMEQSESHKDEKDMIAALQEVAQASPAIMLVAFRSSFKGKYFVETTPHGVIMLDEPDDPLKGRPFYALIAAPTEQDLVRFQRYALAGLTQSNSFEPSAPPIRVDRRDVARLDGQASLWSRHLRSFAIASSRVSLGTLDWFRQVHVPGPVSPLALRIRATTGLPVRSLADFRYQVDVLTLRGGKAVGAPQPVKDFTPEVSGKQDLMTIKFFFPTPEGRTWSVYRVRISAGEGNLKLPAWVDEYSTLSDRDESQGNRTLHLDLFVQSMVRAITESVVFSDHVICLGRGE